MTACTHEDYCQYDIHVMVVFMVGEQPVEYYTDIVRSHDPLYTYLVSTPLWYHDIISPSLVDYQEDSLHTNNQQSNVSHIIAMATLVTVYT